MKLLVLTDAKPGREDEFNEWYTNVHLPDLMAVPGMRGAERLVQVPGRDNHPAQRFLAIYDYDGEPAELLAELAKRAGTERMVISDALDSAGVIMGLYEQVAVLP